MDRPPSDVHNLLNELVSNRIYEFNIDAIMALFLPYHETPHFTKMVSILDIK